MDAVRLQPLNLFSFIFLSKRFILKACYSFGNIVISKNDLVLLVDKKGKKNLIRVEDIKKIKGIGVYDTSNLIGKGYGEVMEIMGKEYTILQPSIIDKIDTIKRKAQIITPKDSAVIAFYCDVKSGDKIVEGGTGSGALTIVLAHLVQPDGKVFSYEKRRDFAEIAQKNIKEAGLEKYVEIKSGDVTSKIDERDADGIIFDIPNPWDGIKSAHDALKSGGHFASYSPTTNQVENTVNELRRYPFVGIKTLETLQREIIVGKGGVRPDFNMLGHTGYVTFGRKILNSSFKY